MAQYSGFRNTRWKKPLPPDFVAAVRDLEVSYLQTDDPILQSGFGGGAKRWRKEREPILEAISEEGTLLDVGCANGYLLECLVRWGQERGLKLTPYGVDLSPRLIALAKERLPAFERHFFVANAWDWHPPRRFRYVYALSDCVPEDYLEAFVERLLSRVVEPGGTLVLGSYGRRSRGVRPLDLRARLAGKAFVGTGFSVQGTITAGTPPTSAFAWLAKT